MARSSHLALAMLAVAALALVLSAAPADAQDQVVALPAPALPPPTPHRRPHASPAADPPRIGASGSAGPRAQTARAPAPPRARVCPARPRVLGPAVCRRTVSRPCRRARAGLLARRRPRCCRGASPFEPRWVCALRRGGALAHRGRPCPPADHAAARHALVASGRVHHDAQ